jgi:hypothetical protein
MEIDVNIVIATDLRQQQQ